MSRYLNILLNIYISNNFFVIFYKEYIFSVFVLDI